MDFDEMKDGTLTVRRIELVCGLGPPADGRFVRDDPRRLCDRRRSFRFVDRFGPRHESNVRDWAPTEGVSPMMNGFCRFRFLAGAVVVLVLFGGHARAGFLAEVSATLNTPSTGADTVGGSSLTLTAMYLPGSSSGLFGNPGTPSIIATSGVMTYSWTLTFPTAGTPGFTLTSTVNGAPGSSTNLVTPTSAITGYYVSGSEIFFQIAGWTSGAPPTGTNNYTTYVDINVFSNKVNIGLIPPLSPGSPGTAGGVSPSPAPEPSTMALLGIGGLSLLARRLHRRRSDA
jgi:hypothetical protein